MKFTESPEFNELTSYIFHIKWKENGKDCSMLRVLDDDDLSDVLLAIEMLNKGVSNFIIDRP